MLLSRDELVTALFCETDRAQRLKMPLSVIAVELADWDAPESEVKQVSPAAAERIIVARITGILRCYDSLGRWANGEFILLLPGCAITHARTLAERLRDEVFLVPVEAGGVKMCVMACFGVASSGGRSPFVVLRDARNALQQARTAGPGSIGCSSADAEANPAAFLIPVLQREDLQW
ncbi:MAG TPA: diguanylate cyclase [Terracidiphilus sp.]|nr:diguanylate cyclase [Terracidiphilus sp.]